MTRWSSWCLLVLLLSTLALGQAPPSPTPEDPSPTPIDTAVPDLRAVKEVPRATVRLDGLPVMTVGPGKGETAEQRAARIRAQLESLVTELQPEERIDIRVFRELQGDNITVQNKLKIYVYDTDLVANGSTQDDLEDEWVRSLRSSLRLAVQERADGHFWNVIKGLALIALLCLLLDRLSAWAYRRYFRLPGWSPRVLIWLTYADGALVAFPQTRAAGLYLAKALLAPVWWLVAVLVLGFLLVRFGRATVAYYFRSMVSFYSSMPSLGPRWRQQMSMYQQLARIAVGLIVSVAMFFLYFAPFEVDWWALITGAGFVTAAIGLALQDLFRDWVAGVNIVLEDQFGVGDWIQVPGAEGRVEAFTMRITRMRNMEGTLITIPNSALRMVSNLSNTWSQVDLRIPVSYQTNVRRALELIEQEGRKLMEEWPDKVAEPPVIMGLEQWGESNLTLRMTMRTFPLMQFIVRRELLLRIRERFTQEGFDVPYAQQVVWLRELSEKVEETGGERVQEADGDVRGRRQSSGGQREP